MRNSFAGVYLFLITVSYADRSVRMDVRAHSQDRGGQFHSIREVAARGEYSSAGSVSDVEGDLLQVHPLGLCETYYHDERYAYGWIGLVKIERPGLVFEPPVCRPLLGKAKRAVQRGAVAIIFIVHDNLGAAAELDDMPSSSRISKPIILVKDRSEANKLFNITAMSKHYSRIRIIPELATTTGMVVLHRNDGQRPAQSGSINYINVAILLASSFLVCVMAVFGFLRCWTRHQTENASRYPSGSHCRPLVTAHQAPRGSTDLVSCESSCCCSTDGAENEPRIEEFCKT